MDEFLSSVFNIALCPFTSGVNIVVVPAMFAFIYGCVCLVFRIMRGR